MLFAILYSAFMACMFGLLLVFLYWVMPLLMPLWLAHPIAGTMIFIFLAFMLFSWAVATAP
jgi:hypothetical protein